ncbi:hypothetical protein BpHYR1_046884 [Brachionus plicatilis]|uniref:Uncharacterized protein n=1 Tax=Brachionus plicatilis TaxID=10195 RepID=A0A3M7PVZ5_BRAPC|nr:hypothetical protein BpHYR1_046884 [Brachionus plicatilis]
MKQDKTRLILEEIKQFVSTQIRDANMRMILRYFFRIKGYSLMQYLRFNQKIKKYCWAAARAGWSERGQNKAKQKIFKYYTQISKLIIKLAALMGFSCTLKLNFRLKIIFLIRILVIQTSRTDKRLEDKINFLQK